MMTDSKEVNKYFRAAKWNFNKAVELAKKNMIVGEIVFPGKEKKIVKERLKKLAKTTSETEGKELL